MELESNSYESRIDACQYLIDCYLAEKHGLIVAASGGRSVKFIQHSSDPRLQKHFLRGLEDGRALLELGRREAVGA